MAQQLETVIGVVLHIFMFFLCEWGGAEGIGVGCIPDAAPCVYTVGIHPPMAPMHLLAFSAGALPTSRSSPSAGLVPAARPHGRALTLPLAPATLPLQTSLSLMWM